jgi:hypothetical protein
VSEEAEITFEAPDAPTMTLDLAVACESRPKTAARNGRKRQQFGCVKLA